MRPLSVPVSVGTETFKSLETESFRITDLWFPPEAVLGPHVHDRACIAVMLHGACHTHIARRSLACDTGYAWTEPIGEQHTNRIGPEGARGIVVQPDASKEYIAKPMARLVNDVHLLRHAGVVGSALRILSAIRERDAIAALCVEALAMLLLSDAARVANPDGHGNRRPGWLLIVRDLLNDEWRAGVTVSRLAGAAGVHPAHLTRTFRRYYGRSLGSYVRALRLEWAVTRLLERRQSISEIACAAGFSDQSHFTREFRKHLGVTPGAYRWRLLGLRS
ncbi:MAG: helix-turn-helix transcriptional regulator [Gemmatimonadaceae bacterium]